LILFALAKQNATYGTEHNPATTHANNKQKEYLHNFKITKKLNLNYSLTALYTLKFIIII
jgi:hypothetical protein